MSNSKPRLLFFGMRTTFSYHSLFTLLAANMEVCAVIIPAAQDDPEGVVLRRREPPSRRRVPLVVNRSSVQISVSQMVWDHNIPLWEVSRLSDPTVLDLVREYQPDLVCVSCFSLYIPRAILDVPRSGVLNVHPSLLPDNRGPDPLFWTFRLGHEQTGVTIHLMNEQMDAGAIVMQEPLKVNEGESYAELEVRAAQLGGQLLVRAIEQMESGQAVLQEQDESQSHYYSFPSSEDFTIHPEQWDARHVYNFICGVKDRGEPLLLVADPELTLAVEDVLVYSYKPNDLRLLTNEPDAWPIRCKRGKVVVKGRPLRSG